MIGSDPMTSASIDENAPIERLLIELSARFVSMPSDQVDREIEDAQRRICECLNLDRSTLWLQPLDRPGERIMTHIYQSLDAPATPVRPEARALFPWSLQQVRAGEPIAIADLDDLPPEAVRDKESYEKYGTKSTLLIPLSIGGTDFGVMSFASVREPLQWSKTLVRWLELFAQIFANAISRARADQQLRDSEQRLRLAADAAGAGLWIVDNQTKKIWVTDKTRQLFGLPEDQELTMDIFLQLVHSADREMVTRAVLDAQEKGSEFQVEYRIVLPDGNLRWISSRGSLRRGRAGEPGGLMGASVSATERKQMEEALRQRNQYIEAVLEQAPIGFAVHTMNDGVGRFVSARFEEIYGVSRGSITSHFDLFDVVWFGDPSFREQIRSRVLADIASGDPHRMRWENVPVKLASGETRYVTATNIPLFDQNLMVSTVQDVTEKVRAESALRESMLRFRQVAEVTNDFIWETDAKGLYTYTSPSVQTILGYTPEELVGRVHFYDLFAPDVRDELRVAAMETFAAKRSFKGFGNTNLSKSGKLVHLETSGVPLLGEAGDLVGYRGADTDVTERKRAEVELHRTLDEVQRLRDRLQQQNVYLQQEVKLLHGHTRIIGQSRALKRVLVQAEQVAPTGSTVLLLGETGTGKELIASEIHELSRRRDRVMVRVNCAAIPASLLESELFGREKGAYTGALSRQMGRFEMANGSTLFLDEIGELPPEVQVKLLRVLQEKQIERLGSPKPISVDVRIIAATNRDLEKAVREGRFREDLYYRLNVFPIMVPPLRERREDVPVLVSALVEEFAVQFGKSIESIDKRCMENLQRYHWPGNIRELRNVIERAMIVASGPKLWIDLPAGAPAAANVSMTMRDTEQQHIRQVLELTNWRIRGKNGAAEILGLKPSTLESRMAKLGIRRQSKASTK